MPQVIYETTPVPFLKRIWLQYGLGWLAALFSLFVFLFMSITTWGIGIAMLAVMCLGFALFPVYIAFERAEWQVVKITANNNVLTLSAMYHNHEKHFEIVAGQLKTRLIWLFGNEYKGRNDRLGKRPIIGFEALKLTLFNGDKALFNQYAPGEYKMFVELENVVNAVEGSSSESL